VPQASKLLENYKATHVVVGTRCRRVGASSLALGNRMFLIDTGMLSSYYPGGRASALEICGDGKFIAGVSGPAGSATRFDRVFASKRRAWGGEWDNGFGKSSRLTRRPYMFRNDGRTAIRQTGYERRLCDETVDWSEL